MKLRDKLGLHEPVDWLRLGLYLFMFIVAAVFLPLAMKQRWGTDIADSLWATVKVLSFGNNPYTYSHEHGLYLGQHVYGTYPPSCLVFLLPLSLFPLHLAGIAWALCNLFFICICLYYIRLIWFSDDVQRPFGFALPALALISMGATHVQIGNGQQLLFSLAFFFAGYYYAIKDRPWLSGFMVALSVLKYTTTFPLLLVFLSLRKFKPLIVGAAIHIVLTILVALWLNCPLADLLKLVVDGTRGLPGAGFGDIASVLHICGVANYGSYAIYGYIFFTLLFLLVTFTGRRDPLLKLSIFAVGSNYMFYHRGYDLAVWIIPIIYATLLVGKKDWQSRLIIALTFLCVAYNCYMPVRLIKIVCPWLLNSALSLGLQYLWFAVLLFANWHEDDRDQHLPRPRT